MALLTNQVMSAAGLTPTMGAVNSEDTVNISSGRVFLMVINGSGGSINVTIETPGTVAGNAIADRVVAVANGATKLIGPLDPAVYADGGIATVGYSGTSSVTAAAIQF